MALRTSVLAVLLLLLPYSAANAEPAAATCDLSGTPTSSAFLPNITKNLGGVFGWVTPFIVQNVGTTATDLQVSFYKFSDGSLVTCRKIAAVGPGASFADIPNNDADLPVETQFSVVVRSFGAQIVAVVNEHSGVGDRAEALSYDGFAAGSPTVSLPNIVRRFFGYHTPFIIQNLGTGPTVATATFVGRGTEPGATITRTIAAGQSQFIEPNVEPSLVDGGAYAVTVRADQPLAVVVNTHNDDASVAHPVAYSTDGITGGFGTLYGAYAAKNANDYGRAGTMSTIVVQNLGGTATTPTLEFTPLGGGATTTFTGPSTGAGAAWAFDPRYVNGVAGTTLCGTGASPGCLADGEFTFKASAAGTIAAAVNVISPNSAMGYTATGSPAAKFFLPNVTRTLGGSGGWTTPILLQSVTARNAYRSAHGREPRERHAICGHRDVDRGHGRRDRRGACFGWRELDDLRGLRRSLGRRRQQRDEPRFHRDRVDRASVVEGLLAPGADHGDAERLRPGFAWKVDPLRHSYRLRIRVGQRGLPGAGKATICPELRHDVAARGLPLHEILIRMSELVERGARRHHVVLAHGEDRLPRGVDSAIPGVAVLAGGLIEVELRGWRKDRERRADLEVIGHELLTGDVARRARPLRRRGRDRDRRRRTRRWAG